MEIYKCTVDGESFEFESDYEYPDFDRVANDAAHCFFEKGEEYPLGSHYQEEYPKWFIIEQKDILGDWVHCGRGFEIDIDDTVSFTVE